MKQKQVKTKKVSRRQVMQIIAGVGAAAACWRFGLKPEMFGYHKVRRSQPMMGTVLNIMVYGPEQDIVEAAVSSTINRMLSLEKLFSRHRPDSEISRLNSDGILYEPSSDLKEVLGVSRNISHHAEGAFDPTILPMLLLYNKLNKQNGLPDKATVAQALNLVDYRQVVVSDRQISLGSAGMAVTLDGIGKGYIVDQGVTCLAEYGFNNVYVEAGGDLMVKGRKANNKPWRIGINNPRPSNPGRMISFPVSDRAVATSGDYLQAFSPDFRHHHIINPHTGFSSPELASCTVIAPTVAMADGLATASMVLGTAKAIELLERLPECEGVLIDKDLKTHRTSGFVG